MYLGGVDLSEAGVEELRAEHGDGDASLTATVRNIDSYSSCWILPQVLVFGCHVVCVCGDASVEDCLRKSS